MLLATSFGMDSTKAYALLLLFGFPLPLLVLVIISGWVRNRRDGTVEALFCGSDEAVAAMIAWARRGPPGACVDRVEVELGSGEFSHFEQHPTA